MTPRFCLLYNRVLLPLNTGRNKVGDVLRSLRRPVYSPVALGAESLAVFSILITTWYLFLWRTDNLRPRICVTCSELLL